MSLCRGLRRWVLEMWVSCCRLWDWFAYSMGFRGRNPFPRDINDKRNDSKKDCQTPMDWYWDTSTPLITRQAAEESTFAFVSLYLYIIIIFSGNQDAVSVPLILIRILRKNKVKNLNPTCTSCSLKFPSSPYALNYKSLSTSSSFSSFHFFPI